MSDEEKQELLETLSRNMAVLQREVGQCRSLIGMLLGRNVNEPFPGMLQGVSMSASSENRLRESVLEAIDTLEETRKAFKSKRLETLRKKLTQVLAEVQGSGRPVLILPESPSCCGSGDCEKCSCWSGGCPYREEKELREKIKGGGKNRP